MPLTLRSGSKCSAAPLSPATTDKTKTARSLSRSKSDSSPLASVMTNPTASNAVDPAMVEECVAKYLAEGANFDTLVKKLSGEIKKAVDEAVKAAVMPFHEEIKTLRGEVTTLTARLVALDTKLNDRTDELEQYQRRNNIRIFGIKEKPGEDTDQLVINLCQEQLDLDLATSALCRTHRVGKKPQLDVDGRLKSRPIIVKFISYKDRRMVFEAKKRLKGSGVTIREDLTARRSEVLKQASDMFGYKNTWTLDGRVMWIDRRGKRGVAAALSDLTAPPATEGNH